MSPPSSLAETDHSIITVVNNENAIVKRSRHRHDPRTVIRWRNEVEALTRVGSHPNIVQLISSSATDFSITLTLAPGQVLSSYNCDTLLPYARQICLQMSHALSHIHALDLVHDDVKPDNIVFSIPDSKVTLIDFGACISRGEFTSSGTPWYMAPEYVERVKGSKTDVWALGVTMAWVVGIFPLPEVTREEWILPRVWEDELEMEKMQEWLRVVEGVRKKLAMEDGELGSVIAKMLDPDVGRRIESVEVARSLEDLKG